MNAVLAVLPPETGGDGGEAGTSSLGECPEVITAVFLNVVWTFSILEKIRSIKPFTSGDEP